MSGLVNGGHGRRITEEPIVFSKSQVPADTKPKWTHKDTAAVAGLGAVMVGSAAGGAMVGRKVVNAASRARLVKLHNKSVVHKAQRYYDPEHRRQRRFGMTETALAIGGGALAAHGIAGKVGMRATTKIARQSVEESTKAKHGLDVSSKLLATSRRSAAETAGGAGLVAGASGLHYHGNHSRGKSWR